MGEDSVKTEFIKRYCYDSEEGKIRHKQVMESNGFYVNEQVRENIGSVDEPLYMWLVQYHKSEYDYTINALAYLNKRLHA